MPHRLPDFIKKWIMDNTTPSSNTRNVVKFHVDGNVIHVLLFVLVFYDRCSCKQSCHSLANRNYSENVLVLQTESGTQVQCWVLSHIFFVHGTIICPCEKESRWLCSCHFTALYFHKSLLNLTGC
jgi:hypothetical protein